MNRMRTRPRPPAPRREAGAALLLALLALLGGGLSLLLGRLTAGDARQAAERGSQAALARAKAALIGRAAVDDNRPGALPCPAEDASGEVPLLRGNHCPTYLGRFPWKTLRTGELRDGHGELLWYALAPALRDDDSARINSRTTPELRADDQPDIAAIVFAPGPPLAAQRRPGNAVADYLEGGNADGDAAYTNGPASAAFNDRLLPISRDELFRIVGKRVLAEIRGPATPTAPPTYGLRHYYHASAAPQAFPWADADGDGHGDTGRVSGRLPQRDIHLLSAPPPARQPADWLEKNRWLELIVYERLGPAAARLSLGDLHADVVPCPGVPCR